VTAALFDRFRAGSLERIRAAKLTVADLEEGQAGGAALKRVLGELHTLKGESRMLGLALVSQIAHAVEECLAPALKGTRISPEVAAGCRDGLEAIARSLRGELGAEASSAETLQLTLDDLTALCEAFASGGDEPPPPLPIATAPERRISERPHERWTQVKTSQVDQICEQVHDFTATFGQLRAEVRAALGSASPRSRQVLDQFERTETQLYDLVSSAWALRLVPVEPSLAQLVEHARDLALIQSKRVRVSVDAGGTQLERSILDQLWDPLLHLLRNAIDHGIEPLEERGDKPVQATVVISARSDGPNVLVTIADDGRGIDGNAVRAAAVDRGLMSDAVAAALSETEVLDLLFSHGFTTRKSVTEVSGRGVGLDVVRRKIDGLGGKVSVSSEVGRGTSFTLSVPASLTRERVLVFALGDALFGVPSRSTMAVVALEPNQHGEVAGGRIFRHGGGTYPLQSLALTLGFPQTEREDHAVLLELFGERRAYCLSTLCGEHEVVRRPVDDLLSAMGTVGGSATLDDGRLVLLVRPEALAGRIRARPAPQRGTTNEQRQRRVLIADDSPIVRELLTEMLSSSGLVVHAAEDGLAALRILETIQPDLVLSDVEMPRMGGLELLRRIRGQNQRLPVVMLTTRGSAADRKAAAELGADAYLVKSDFEGSKLLDTISRFINLRP
jgi:chemotaxis protein histidine kinase CheA/CheY-like chemotaxis protein